MDYNRKWIIENAIEEIQNYEKGVLTLRGLHYRLVSRGMTNDIRHYKKVISAMTVCRWDGQVDFDVFSDNDREMIGTTEAATTVLEDEIESGKRNVEAWLKYYRRNRWENQDIYPEVFIEKKALQGVFESVCLRKRVALGACKGYPSLTFLAESAERIKTAQSRGQQVVILYFGDYDPSGEDIPRSIGENLERLGCYGVEVRRIALLEDQVIDWNLPPAPVKPGDSRSVHWDGLGQVELDAVEPKKLQRLCREAIEECFDESRHDELKAVEAEERVLYREQLKDFVLNMDFED
jgi:hypothetical protein